MNNPAGNLQSGRECSTSSPEEGVLAMKRLILILVLIFILIRKKNKKEIETKHYNLKKITT